MTASPAAHPSVAHRAHPLAPSARPAGRAAWLYDGEGAGADA